uniref:Uncharacterized protein n=1 Tax=Scophthalmus maximus TaxID=52904 RepID=A0A8D3CFF1_SCOMX
VPSSNRYVPSERRSLTPSHTGQLRRRNPRGCCTPGSTCSPSCVPSGNLGRGGKQDGRSIARSNHVALSNVRSEVVLAAEGFVPDSKVEAVKPKQRAERRQNPNIWSDSSAQNCPAVRIKKYLRRSFYPELCGTFSPHPVPRALATVNIWMTVRQENRLNSSHSIHARSATLQQYSFPLRG